MIGPIFKAYDVRATYPDPLNEDAAWKVGYAVGQFFFKHNGDKPGRVLVSRDMRPSSRTLAEALVEGILTTAHDVYDLGQADTSLLYYAIPDLGALGGVQTTASHNPVNYNGFKISGEGAKPIGADSGLQEIEAMANSVERKGQQAHGKYHELEMWRGYREHILKFLTPLKKPVKIYIDASNGMAGKMIPTVFHNVPNLEIIPLNFEITGSFEHEPNPLVAENMVPTQEGVKVTGADLGACFDGDADRCMICDDKGQTIGCDHLTAFLAHHFVAKERSAGNESPTVAYDLRSSKVVSQTLGELGAKGKRSRVGHVFMKAALRETNAVFGGELSGHFYFRDNSFADSGAIAMASVLSVLGQADKPLSELIAPFRKYPQSGEINFQVDDKQAVMDKLKSQYADKATVDELDGVTIDCFDKDGYWFNVRPSNTEPLLRLNAEAKNRGTLETLLKQLEPQLGKVAEH